MTLSIRLTTAQRAKLETLGGAAWVRERIDNVKACPAAVRLERERCADLVERGRVACNWNDREALAQFIRQGLRVVGPDGQVA